MICDIWASLMVHVATMQLESRSHWATARLVLLTKMSKLEHIFRSASLTVAHGDSKQDHMTVIIVT